MANFTLIQKQFLTLLVQETSSDDYVGNLICRDERGRKWLLRGFGTTMVEAAEAAEYLYQYPTNEWIEYGQLLPEGVEL